uniref:uL18 n=1 Tax=Paranosema locustae TaxID=235221 RepID=UPI00187D6E35|nr:Chain LD0, uL18 [Paranosema locustae]|eukprot:jgi/Antlo1/1443/2538
MTDNKIKKSYFSRFQTKLRRRREGKTDYKHRYNLIRQDVNKHGLMKIRLVVRITNSRIICEILRAHVDGDRSIAYADSTELKRYGITFGLKNYTAAYATGLLVACRYNNKIAGEGPRPECYLDIGLRRSTRGARVFGAMKGALDGGLVMPHSLKRVPGYVSEEEFDSEVFRNKLFGKILAGYMKEMMENYPEKYKKTFQEYIKKGINPDDLENIYENAFKKIREDPSRVSKTHGDYSIFKEFKRVRLSKEERAARSRAKLLDIEVK